MYYCIVTLTHSIHMFNYHNLPLKNSQNLCLNNKDKKSIVSVLVAEPRAWNKLLRYIAAELQTHCWKSKAN